MKITLLSDDRIRLEGGGGPLSIEAATSGTAYSPFHMLASGLATCAYSVLYSWAEQARLAVDDLAIEVEWRFADEPHRVGRYELFLLWPSLPEARRPAAARTVDLCPVHATFGHPPDLVTVVRG